MGMYGELGDMTEILDEYVIETNELIEQLYQDLALMRTQISDELVNRIFRSFHTIKGISGFLSFDECTGLAHASEDLLNKIRNAEMTPDQKIIDVLWESVDWFKMFVGDVGNRVEGAYNTSPLKNAIADLLQSTSRPMLDSSEATSAQVKPKLSIPQFAAGFPEDLIDQFVMDITHSESRSQLGVAGKKPSRITEQKRLVPTIRVEVQRLDKLMNLADELVLEKDRLLQLSQRLANDLPEHPTAIELGLLNTSLGPMATAIQDSVLQLRLVPIATVFRKFPRIVRDMAREMDKAIELVISGEDTELDHSVIKAIGDPMIHLLRNAIVHGIETTESRRSKGKSPRGIISLDAYQEGAQIVILIKDDGAGIDPAKILAKSIEKGIVSSHEASNMKPQEIIDLIFRPGFSTTEKITDVSGRGVGMDIVNTNVSELGGLVEIESEINIGSVFIIKFPLRRNTLTDSMKVGVHE